MIYVCLYAYREALKKSLHAIGLAAAVKRGLKPNGEITNSTVEGPNNRLKIEGLKDMTPIAWLHTLLAVERDYWTRELESCLAWVDKMVKHFNIFLLILKLSSILPYVRPSFLPSSLPSFLPSFGPSFFPSFLTSVLPSFCPSVLPSFHPSFCSSYLISFLPSYLPSLLPSFLPSFRPSPTT